MKQFGLWLVTATVVLGFTTLSIARTPLATPIAAMSDKGEMKGETKGDMKDDMKGGMKQSDGMTEKKSDKMMLEQSDGMEKKSDGMMEKRSRYRCRALRNSRLTRASVRDALVLCALTDMSG